MNSNDVCIHEWEFINSDYDQIVTLEGTKDGYVEFFECIHCSAKMKQLYVFLKEEIYDE